jgi:hypothetical protein
MIDATTTFKLAEYSIMLLKEERIDKTGNISAPANDPPKKINNQRLI